MNSSFVERPLRSVAWSGNSIPPHRLKSGDLMNSQGRQTFPASVFIDECSLFETHTNCCSESTYNPDFQRKRAADDLYPDLMTLFVVLAVADGLFLIVTIFFLVIFAIIPC
jgi:hypothetical protein